MIHEIVGLLKKASHAVVLTGAGMSSESGIPTFRGGDGLWKKYNPMELATYEAFIKDPKKVWEWYKWRMDIIWKAKPHKGYYILADWERRGLIKAIITQNVDGLHYRAGSKRVVELHGNIFRVRCIKCNYREEIKESLKEIPPKCPICGSYLRPDVVWFGEPLDVNIVSRAYDLSMNSDLFFVIGTSGVVYPAAELPYIARRNGAKIIEINIEKTPISRYADYTLSMEASEALTAIHEELD
jgi:NAD-dependent deacetylase